jgi:hypothetical protein
MERRYEYVVTDVKNQHVNPGSGPMLVAVPSSWTQALGEVLARER